MTMAPDMETSTKEERREYKKRFPGIADCMQGERSFEEEERFRWKATGRYDIICGRGEQPE